MKNVLALVTITLLGTACGSESKKASPSPAPVTTSTNTSTASGDATAGKTAFVDNCVSCHGTDGKSGSADTNITTVSETVFSNAVLKGTGSMAKVSGMTATDVKNMFAYVSKTLKK